MTGNNEMRLNEATMIQALQQWLDSKMPHGAPKVTSVKKESGSTYEPNIFTVGLTSEEKPNA